MTSEELTLAVQELERQGYVKKDAFGIDFLDPLFAITIHIGFAEGLLTAGWFHEWRPPRNDEWFDIFVFCLGFLTLMLSWVGYHASIKKAPLLPPKTWAVLSPRFWLDVLCVLGYAAMLVAFKHFAVVMVFLAIVFLLYVIWDLFKVWEAPDQRKWGRRENVTLLYFVLLLFFAVVQLILTLAGYYTLLGSVCILIGAYICVFLYRVHKEVEFGKLWPISLLPHLIILAIIVDILLLRSPQ